MAQYKRKFRDSHKRICVQMRVMRGSQEKIFEIILIVYRENFYRRLTKQNEAYQHKEKVKLQRA